MNQELPPQKTLKPVLIAGLAAMCVAVLGGLLTDIGPWYKGLLQPAFKPPDTWFGPAWTLIFIFAAAAAAVAWKQTPDRASRYWLVGLFALNAALNSLWSLLFFKLQRPDWALLEVGFLWLSIAALMWAMKSYSRRACALLLPYLLWVSLAIAINYATVQLNGPFRQAF
ncbi:MAG: TspO/MBR family protein [Polaromonas sp.]|jgi:benzodiazapine receptor|nr:TspO/MBR family protein [Polaromonas sp.]